MGNLSKTLESGAKLDITMASFEVGLKLFKAVSYELEKVDLRLGIKAKSLKELFDLEISDAAINTLKNVIMRIIASERVEEVLWQCMDKATYNNKRINKDIFEHEDARGDYLIVAKEVLWFNLSPFFKNLSSKFLELQEKSTSSPE